MSFLSGMTTSEGSPRANLLQQAVKQGQTAAHMNPMSFQRGPIHGQSQDQSVMTFLPKGKATLGHEQQLQQALSMIARYRLMQGQLNSPKNSPIWHPPTSDGVSGGLGPLRPPKGGGGIAEMLPLLLHLVLSSKGGA